MEIQPNTLPIYLHQSSIVDLIEANRVLVLSGKTGCGKSTQVPKFILDSHPHSKIAVCQPRRLAATSLAYRVSSQLGCKIGEKVGYQIGMDNKADQQTRIKFMTYGILIQELLFNKNTKYTHIILDQVHERSLEMDFLFIALRKLLDTPQYKNVKLIIMSATINSKSFSEYFATSHATGKFNIPTITYTVETNEPCHQGRRGRRKQMEQKQEKKVKANIQKDPNSIPAQYIDLPDQNKYQIKTFYLEDINKYGEDEKPDLYHDEDIITPIQVYATTTRLIREFLKKGQSGDILIFVPGMQEIKYLKHQIQLAGLLDQEQSIIQVHSAYSEELQNLLFVEQKKNKIIIATNIGESSITLPNCKIVIDFCLTRKYICVKGKDYCRFETRLASKANLLQRSGRVGRVSNGDVYRLISKQQFNLLADFQMPQIQCVKLEMAILRAKKLDYASEMKLFEDPYDVFLNAIEPPSIQAIEQAVQTLVKYQALTYDQKRQQNEYKFKGEHLRLSAIGRFMVKLPCTIKISRMILFSLQLGITPIIVSIASILMPSRKFFAHEQRIANIEDFMHTIVNYDSGQYNDFYLRHRIFNEWKDTFFSPIYNKYQHHSRNEVNINQLVENEDMEIDSMVEDFCQHQVSKNEKQWCIERGVYPNVLRQILKINSNIKCKLMNVGIEVKEVEEVQNQLVLFCLCCVFESNISQVKWENHNPKRDLGKSERKMNFVQLPARDESTLQKTLKEYLRCSVDEFQIKKIENYNRTRVYATPSILSKFLLPKVYAKGNKKYASQFYQELSNTDLRIIYPLEPSVYSKQHALTILNESINKGMILIDPKCQYSLIGEKIFKSKHRFYMAECALIQKNLLNLIWMLITKDLMLEIHHSGQFIHRLIVNGKQNEISLFLTNKDIEMIQQIRKWQLWKPNHKIELNQEESSKRKDTLLRVFMGLKNKEKMEKWMAIYQEKFYKQTGEPSIFHIDQCPKLNQDSLDSKENPSCKDLPYFQDYFKWKQSYAKELKNKFWILYYTQPHFICAECRPEIITSIQYLSSFHVESQTIKINEYLSSWVGIADQIFCRKNHKVGVKIDENRIQLDLTKVLVYAPYCNFFEFQGKQEEKDEIIKKSQEGVKELAEIIRNYDRFECDICFESDDHIMRVQQYQDAYDAFQKQLAKHMFSKSHRANETQFMSNL